MLGYAVVDVETSGLSPESDRVLSVAVLATDRDGNVQDRFATLVNADCDPGPTWVHGLTLDRLRGAPRYADVRDRLHGLLDSRILVAHNAQFDHTFLFHESRRTGVELPTTHRLCTVALARRLELPVPDYRLATLAAHWNLAQGRLHDAEQDALVLHQVLLRSIREAAQFGVPLPVLACHGRGDAGHVTRVRPRTSRFANPETWRLGDPLRQGMKLAITGPTRTPREALKARLESAGLHVTGSVSSQTRLLVTNDGQTTSGKMRAARQHGTAVCDESALLRLMNDVQPGLQKQASPSKPGAGKSSRPTGPWHGTRVLVLGGNHNDAVTIREELSARGARILVTLAATTTHVVVLPGGEHDPRMAKIRSRRLITLSPDEVTAPPGDISTLPSETTRPLVRGEVVDIPSDADRVSIHASWSPREHTVVDVVALLTNAAGQVRADEDLVFFNAPATPDGSVSLSIDGDAEQGVTVDLDEVPSDVARITVASAIEGATFGDLGPMQVRVGDLSADLASGVLDAATDEASLVLAELYRRGDGWRLRLVGRGFTDGLRGLVERYGVDVDDE